MKAWTMILATMLAVACGKKDDDKSSSDPQPKPKATAPKTAEPKAPAEESGTDDEGSADLNLYGIWKVPLDGFNVSFAIEFGEGFIRSYVRCEEHDAVVDVSVESSAKITDRTIEILEENSDSNEVEGVTCSARITKGTLHYELPSEDRLKLIAEGEESYLDRLGSLEDL